MPIPHLYASASFSGSLADPGGSSAIVAAVSWLQQTMLGTIATTAAIIAVASVGFLMMSGRVNVRHGATVVAGCFVLFGASTIVAGIRSFVGGGGGDRSYSPSSPPPVVMPPPSPPAVPPSNNDPYAGASVPAR